MNIHPLSDVQTSRKGEDTRIWPFAVIPPGVQIGADCNICPECFIGHALFIQNRR